jgi:hypothetical protein
MRKESTPAQRPIAGRCLDHLDRLTVQIVDENAPSGTCRSRLDTRESRIGQHSTKLDAADRHSDHPAAATFRRVEMPGRVR